MNEDRKRYAESMDALQLLYNATTPNEDLYSNQYDDYEEPLKKLPVIDNTPWYEDVYNFVFEPDPEDVKKNTSALQKGIEDAKAKGLTYGSLNFEYDNQKDFSNYRIGMGLASGDLVMEGNDIYRVKDIQTRDRKSVLGGVTKGRLEIKQPEVLPIAFQQDNGQIKTYKYWDTDFNKTVKSETRRSLAEQRGKSTSAGNQIDAGQSGFTSSLVKPFGWIGDAFTDGKNVVLGTDKLNDARNADYATSRAAGEMAGEIVKTIVPVAGMGLAAKATDYALKPWQIGTAISAIQEVPRTISDVANNEITPVGGLLRTGLNTAANIASIGSGATSSTAVGKLLGDKNLRGALKKAGLETAKQIGYAVGQTSADIGMDILHSSPLQSVTGQQEQRNFFKEFLINGGTMAAMNVATEVLGFGRVKGFGAISEEVRWNVDRFKSKAESRITDFYETKVNQSQPNTKLDINAIMKEASQKGVVRDSRSKDILRAKLEFATADPVVLQNKILAMFAMGENKESIIAQLNKQNIGVLPSEKIPTETMVEQLGEYHNHNVAPYSSDKKLIMVRGEDGKIHLESAWIYAPETSAVVVDNIAKKSLGEDVSIQLQNKYGIIESHKEVSNVERQNIGEYLDVQLKNPAFKEFKKFITSDIVPISKEAGMGDKKIVSTILSIYNKVTGDTPAGKSITDIVDTVANYTAGTVKAQHFDSMPGKFIDREALTLYPDIDTKIMAKSDRKRIFNAIASDIVEKNNFDLEEFKKLLFGVFDTASNGKAKKAPVSTKPMDLQQLESWFVNKTTKEKLTYNAIEARAAVMYAQAGIGETPKITGDINSILPFEDQANILAKEQLYAEPSQIEIANPETITDIPIVKESDGAITGEQPVLSPEQMQLMDIYEQNNTKPKEPVRLIESPQQDNLVLTTAADTPQAAANGMLKATYENPVAALLFDGPKVKEVEVLSVHPEQNVAIIDVNPTEAFDLRKVPLNKLKEVDSGDLDKMVQDGHVVSTNKKRKRIAQEPIPAKQPIVEKQTIIKTTTDAPSAKEELVLSDKESANTDQPSTKIKDIETPPNVLDAVGDKQAEFEILPRQKARLKKARSVIFDTEAKPKTETEIKSNDGEVKPENDVIRTKSKEEFASKASNEVNIEGKKISSTIELNKPDNTVDDILNLADAVDNLDALHEKLVFAKNLDENKKQIKSDKINAIEDKPEFELNDERKASIDTYNSNLKKINELNAQQENALVSLRNNLRETEIGLTDAKFKKRIDYLEIKNKFDQKKKPLLAENKKIGTPAKIEKDALRESNMGAKYKKGSIIQTNDNQKNILLDHIVDKLHIKSDPNYMSIKGNDMTIVRNDNEFIINSSSGDIRKDLELLNNDHSLQLTHEDINTILDNAKTAQRDYKVKRIKISIDTNPIIMRSGFEGAGGAALYLLGSNIDDDSDWSFAKTPLMFIGGVMIAGQAYHFTRDHVTKQLNGAMPVTKLQKFFVKDYEVGNSLTRENYKRSMLNKQPDMASKEKLNLLYDTYEEQAKTLKNSTVKLFRSLTHVKGDLVKKIQYSALEGIHQQQLMNHAVAEKQTLAADALFKSDNYSKSELREKLIEANNKLYTEATYILRDPDIDAATKKSQLDELNTESSIKQVLESTGIRKEDLDKALKAYEAHREVANTLTYHDQRAKGMNKYGFDLDDIENIKPQLEAEVNVLVDALNKAKDDVKKRKKDFKLTTQYKTLQTVKAKSASQIVKDRKSAKSLLINDSKLIALQGKLELAKQDLSLKANKLKAIEYALDFVDNSKLIHHMNRFELAKQDKPFAAAMYEILGTGKRVHENYSRIPAEMNYFKTENERTAYVNKWLTDHNAKPLETNELPNVWEVTVDTDKGSKKILVKINDDIHDGLANQYNVSINQVRRKILQIKRNDANYNVNRLELLNELRKLKDTHISNDLDGANYDGDSTDLLDELVASLEASTDTDVSANIIKDVLNYAVQPKATSQFRNKNVIGYKTDNISWSDIYDYGIERDASRAGNTYTNTYLRDALEKQILESKSLGISNAYTLYLNDLYDDIVYAGESTDYVKRVTTPQVTKIVNVIENVAVLGAMGTNVNSAIKNTIGGVTTVIGRVAEEGYLPTHVATGLKGLKDNFKGTATTAYGKDNILNDIHSSVMKSGIVEQTAVSRIQNLASITGKMKEVMKHAFIAMGLTEKTNRYMSAMAYAASYVADTPYKDFSGAMSKEQYVKDVTQKAALFVGETQGLYDFIFRTDAEKLLLRKVPFGKQFLTLISPSINFLAMHSNMLKRAIYSDVKSSKFKALAGFLGTAITAWALGGAEFVTGLGDAATIYETANGDDEKMLHKADIALRNKLRESGMREKDIDLFSNAWHKGILSAATNIDFSMKNSAIELLIPFLGQVGYQLATKDIKSITTEGWEGITKVMSRRFVAPGRILRAGKQLAAGQVLDKNDNPLGRGYGASDFVAGAVFGDKLEDKIARERGLFIDYDLTTPQGKRKFISNAFLSNIDFGKMNIKRRNRLKAEVNSNQDLIDNAEKIYSEINKEKRTPLMRNTIETTDKRIQDFLDQQGDKELKETSLKQGEFVGSNDIAKSYKEKMKNAADRYIDVQSRLPAIKKYYSQMGINQRIQNKYDKVSLRGLIPQGKELGKYPIEDRAWYYALYQFYQTVEED